MSSAEMTSTMDSLVRLVSMESMTLALALHRSHAHIVLSQVVLDGVDRVFAEVHHAGDEKAWWKEKSLEPLSVAKRLWTQDASEQHAP